MTVHACMLVTPNSVWGTPGRTFGGCPDISDPWITSYGTNTEKHLYKYQAFSGSKPVYLLHAWYFTASLHLLVLDSCACYA